MLSAVPPAIATTLLIGALFLGAPRRDYPEGSATLAESFGRQHLADLESLSPTTAPGTVVPAPLPAPFVPLVAWQSAVVDVDGTRWLLTWPETDPVSAQFDAIAFAGLALALRAPREGVVAGRWDPANAEGTLGRIGDYLFPAPAGGIGASTPVLASPLL